MSTTTTTTTRPPTTGWPGPSNTGVPPGTALRPSGDITINTAGTVIDGLDVSGCILVRASNVTIKRTRVRGACWGGAIDTDYGAYRNIMISDVEIDGLGQMPQAALLGNNGFTCLRCNIHHGGRAVSMGGDVVIQDSWLHDEVSGPGTHNTAAGSNGGSNMTVRHSVLDINTPEGASAALSFYGDFSPVDNITVDNNLFNGGAYCTMAGSVEGKPYPQATNVRYTNNHFGRKYAANCGQYGPVAFFDGSAQGSVWSGNVWDDTGAPINA
jgi:hypothetical protein